MAETLNGPSRDLAAGRSGGRAWAARHWAGLRNAAVILAVWELLGRFDLVAGGALPAPGEILVRFWQDRGDYPGHVMATLWGSATGFLIGNAVAVAAGILFVLSPLASRLSRGINIAVFSVPSIAIAPILVLTLSGMAPRIVLAAISCYFVTMTATVIGLTQIDQRTADVIRAYGGGRWKVMRLVRLRSALPVILGGLQVAAPNAVLGAILAEFGGGGRWGLGNYLLGSLGRADPARLWGIGLVATAISGLAYLAFSLISHKVTGASRAVTVTTSVPPLSAAGGDSLAARVMLVAGSVALPLATDP